MGTTNEEKSHLCTVRMSETEWARVNAVAEHHGVNASAVIRMLLKREERDLGIEPAKTTKQTKK